MDTKSILKNIQPTTSQRKLFYETASIVCDKINAVSPSAHARLGGSGAKDTWLATSADIDIFVAFPYEQYHEKSAVLSDLVEKSLHKSFPDIPIQRLHGSRDYFQFQYHHYLIEVVPIIEITKASQACNITDVSPLHVAWVKDQGKNLVDDIRLAKQFCKAQRVYGAESYIGGVSGYVVEILVIHYGSFEKFVQAVTKWKEGQVIDPTQFYAKGMARFNLNSSKMRCPLIVIDPVDKNRNAAAALNMSRWQRLKVAATKYLKNPDTSFFTLFPFSVDSLKIKAGKNKLLCFHVIPLEGKIDVVGAKMMKTHEYIAQHLEPFGIVETDWEWSNGKNALFYFILKKNKQPATQRIQGPPTHMKEAATAFCAKHKENVEEDGKLVAHIAVRYPLLEDQIKVLLESAYVASRINGVEDLKIV
ncbi:hypothetical protein HYV86_07745 [Candidatus Woesearchaeota archaeon]|nr:hypothetical protein [Candidatus Woesearchaeota archaeon]